MELDIPWKPEYGDKNSDEYKKLVAQVQETLLEALKSSGVSGVQVVSLGNGTVDVKFVLGFDSGNVNISDVNAAINTAISNDGLSAINATGTVDVAGK